MRCQILNYIQVSFVIESGRKLTIRVKFEKMSRNENANYIYDILFKNYNPRNYFCASVVNVINTVIHFVHVVLQYILSESFNRFDLLHIIVISLNQKCSRQIQ